MEYELRKIDFVKRENDDLKRSANENLDLKRSLAELENKTRLLTTENEKLSNLLRQKSEELHNQEFRLKTYEREIETLK